MNPLVIAAIIILLVLYTGAFAAMSLVGFISDRPLELNAGSRNGNDAAANHR